MHGLPSGALPPLPLPPRPSLLTWTSPHSSPIYLSLFRLASIPFHLPLHFLVVWRMDVSVKTVPYKPYFPFLLPSIHPQSQRMEGSRCFFHSHDFLFFSLPWLKNGREEHNACSYIWLSFPVVTTLSWQLRGEAKDGSCLFKPFPFLLSVSHRCCSSRGEVKDATTCLYSSPPSL